MLDLTYPNILNLFSLYQDPKRTESASFLIWYLEHYYRLDSLEAVDSVCDQSGDKGIDGIYVNEGANTIDVFQSKLFQDARRTLGDAHLREFRGSMSQFDSEDALRNLVNTAGDADVARLVVRLNLIEKLGSYPVRGFFLTNVDPDANASGFLTTEPNIVVVGKSDLEATYISDSREVPHSDPVSFDVTGIPICKYVLSKDARVLIAPLKAQELVALHGISDQSIFAFNVRGSLGRTKVNRDIVDSIKDAALHKFFPLFHNGITMISGRVSDSEDKIEIENYHVVNGCQSLSELFRNRDHLTGELRVLVKIIEMRVDSPLSEQVTQFSNNQNGVRARDFKSNNPIQIRLQREFREKYNGLYALEIKRGEQLTANEIISNEDAGLYLTAFDLGEPWSTHRKYALFDEKHTDVFARPEVTADRILFCHLIVQIIVEKTPNIENGLFGKYALTKYAILHMFRKILDGDDAGKGLLADPNKAVGNRDLRRKLIRTAGEIIDDMIVDINHELHAFGEDIDYRGMLRDSERVTQLTTGVVSTREKLVQRNRLPSFHAQWTDGPG